jgi:hypothetical protein
MIFRLFIICGIFSLGLRKVAICFRASFRGIVNLFGRLLWLSRLVPVMCVGTPLGMFT